MEVASLAISACLVATEAALLTLGLLCYWLARVWAHSPRAGGAPSKAEPTSAAGCDGDV